jgi:hypothetical protein
MNTLGHEKMLEVQVRNVHFEGDMMFVELSDQRQIGLPFKKIKWLDWLAKATPEQRGKWAIEPYGYAVWWEELDDGFEVEHVLSLHPLPHKQESQEAKPILVTP